MPLKTSHKHCNHDFVFNGPAGNIKATMLQDTLKGACWRGVLYLTLGRGVRAHCLDSMLSLFECLLFLYTVATIVDKGVHVKGRMHMDGNAPVKLTVWCVAIDA
jgi:hypothetical protein